MEQLSLVEAGVFILKKKYWVIATALVMAVLMAVFCCFTKPSREETITLKLAADPTLDTFISQTTDKSTVFLTGDDVYPFDDKVTEYVEKIKTTKSGSGRVNPYLGHSRLSVESIRQCLTENKFKSFLLSNGIDASIGVTLTEENVKISLSYDESNGQLDYYNLVVEKTLEYLSITMDEYVTDTLNTHKKLLEEDTKLINQILADYKEAEKTANNDPLALEKCRSLLSTYAQAAYNNDVSNTVVMLSNQLLAIDLGYDAEVIGYTSSNNKSVGVIVVFLMFGFIVGVVLGCFGVFVYALVEKICKTSKAGLEEKDVEENTETIAEETEEKNE